MANKNITATPTKYTAVISDASYDEAGEGLWVVHPDIYRDVSKEEAIQHYKALLDEIVNFATGEEADVKIGVDFTTNDLEIKFKGSEEAHIYYGSVTRHIKLTLKPE